MDNQNIPCATLKRRGSWVISVYLCSIGTYRKSADCLESSSLLLSSSSCSTLAPPRKLKEKGLLWLKALFRLAATEALGALLRDCCVCWLPCAAVSSVICFSSGLSACSSSSASGSNLQLFSVNQCLVDKHWFQ